MKKIHSPVILSSFIAFFSNVAPIAAGKGSLSTLFGMLLFSFSQGDSWYKYSTEATRERQDITYNIFPVSNDEIIATGPYGDEGSFLAAMNGNGVEQWSEVFPNTTFSAVACSDNGGCYAVGKKKVVRSYGNASAIAVARFNDDPYSLQWIRYPWVSKDVDVEAIIATEDGVEGTGVVYGGFTSNTSFSAQPQVLLFRYDKLGNSYIAGAMSTAAKFDMASSLVEDGAQMRSILGTSSYTVDTDNAALGLSLSKVKSSSTGFVHNMTRIFLVGETSTLPSLTQGFVGMKHVKTSLGNYYIVGALVGNANNVTNTTAYTLFGAEVRANDSYPLWFRFINETENFVGFDVAEHPDDGSFFAVGERVDGDQRDYIAIKAKQGSGESQKSKIFLTEDYNISSGSSVHVLPNGAIFTHGIITNQSSGYVDFFLGRWRKDLQGCSSDVVFDFPYIPLVLGSNIGSGSVDIAPLYVIQDSATLETGISAISRERLCHYTSADAKENGWWEGFNTAEQVGIIIGYSAAGICVILTLVLAYRKCDRVKTICHRCSCCCKKEVQE